MRAVVCSRDMPAYDRASGSRRVWDTIMFLVEAGWEVTFVAHRPRHFALYASRLAEHGVQAHHGEEALTGLLEAGAVFDVAVLAFWDVAETELPTLRSLSPTTVVVVDTVDFHLLREARTQLSRHRSDGGKPALDEAWSERARRELNVYASADAVLTVSDDEAVLVRALVRVTPVFGVHDCEDLAPSAVPFEERRGILFVGNFEHAPNIGALAFLCREILPFLDPELLREHPVLVVGNAVDEAVRELAAVPHTRLVGWVPSVVPYFERARASVVPLRVGAGTKRKLIQALAVGTPTVSTSVGVEGLGLRAGEHVLVANEPRNFAAHLERILTDEELWHRLATDGREVVVVRHGRERVRRLLLDVLAEILADAAPIITASRGSVRSVAPPTVTAPLPPPRQGRVLVAGVYLADQPNTMAHLVREFATTTVYDVTQRWAALFGRPASSDIAAVTTMVEAQPAPKFALLDRLLESEDLDAYDFVILSDDDIEVPEGFVDAYLGVVEHAGFCLAQPARTGDSYIDHPIVEQQCGVLARRTRFVEIGPLVSVHRSAYDLTFPFDLASGMGWGYESVWAQRLVSLDLRMGIVDVVPVRHALRPPVSNYRWAEADRQRTAFLQRRAHLPLDECYRVLEVVPMLPSASGGT